ncbi:MAG: riboflavin biosynthesis protein RibF [Oscillospiraceae bacterium]
MRNIKGRVIALGFFDGVHLGHRALIEKTIERAAERGITPSVISFDAHPSSMTGDKPVPLINSSIDRADMFRRYFGIEDTIFLHFDRDLMSMEWYSFVDWLTEGFGARHLVAGYDFRFGFHGAGDSERLVKKCAQLGIGCDIVPKVTLGGITISSTYIRELLTSGRVEEANRFMGHPHTLTDTVRHGFRLGSALGIPTINMQFGEGILQPARGVYATKVYLENGGIYTAVTNIGVRPTVSGGNTVSVESHILDYSGNLYGRRVRLEFFKYLRPEVKFADVTALRTQVEKDENAAREFFESIK